MEVYQLINVQRQRRKMDQRTATIFRYHCLIKKCREKGRFETAIKLKDKIENMVFKNNNRDTMSQDTIPKIC